MRTPFGVLAVWVQVPREEGERIWAGRGPLADSSARPPFSRSSVPSLVGQHDGPGSPRPVAPRSRGVTTRSVLRLVLGLVHRVGAGEGADEAADLAAHRQRGVVVDHVVDAGPGRARRPPPRRGRPSRRRRRGSSGRRRSCRRRSGPSTPTGRPGRAGPGRARPGSGPR